MEIFITLMEIVGTIAFAISGAMVAVKKNMDILGIVILGITTAVGGRNNTRYYTWKYTTTSI